MSVIALFEPQLAAAHVPPSLSLDLESRRGGVAARRNVLFGLWAARRLGLLEAEHEGYAWSVHFADFEEPDDDYVIAKVAADFAARGVAISDRMLRHHLREMELRAFFQLSVSARSRGRSRGRKKMAGQNA